MCYSCSMSLLYDISEKQKYFILFDLLQDSFQVRPHRTHNLRLHICAREALQLPWVLFSLDGKPWKTRGVFQSRPRDMSDSPANCFFFSLLYASKASYFYYVGPSLSQVINRDTFSFLSKILLGRPLGWGSQTENLISTGWGKMLELEMPSY